MKEDVEVASGDGDGVGSLVWVGASAPVGDGVGSKVGEGVGTEVLVGDVGGRGVQLNARESATNPNIIAENLIIATGACRKAWNVDAWCSLSIG